jgi:hypothetical protein
MILKPPDKLKVPPAAGVTSREIRDIGGSVDTANRSKFACSQKKPRGNLHAKKENFGSSRSRNMAFVVPPAPRAAALSIQVTALEAFVPL